MARAKAKARAAGTHGGGALAQLAPLPEVAVHAEADEGGGAQK